jgi:hypothetical protein
MSVACKSITTRVRQKEATVSVVSKVKQHIKNTGISSVILEKKWINFKYTENNKRKALELLRSSDTS